jgi:hypothetical protein
VKANRGLTIERRVDLGRVYLSVDCGEAYRMRAGVVGIRRQKRTAFPEDSQKRSAT